jgi:hypothetical protein
MKNLIKCILLPFLHLLRKIISVFINHVIPRKPRPLPPDFNHPRAYEQYYADEIDDSYQHFKKYFQESIFLKRYPELREYAIKKALQNHKTDYYYLEFGVFEGNTINFFSNILEDVGSGDIEIHGFDSFEGLKEDWVGLAGWPAGILNLNKEIPNLSKNVVPVVGWVQDSLPQFISENVNMKINFVHMDLDTYPSSKFVLNAIKPFLADGAILLFDQLYNIPGWRVGEYKALIEEFAEEEFKFIAFAVDSCNVAIQYKK